VAAGIGAQPGNLERVAAASEAPGGAVDAEELGKAGSVGKHDFHPTAEQPGIDLRADAHAHVGRDLQPVPGF